MNFNMENRNSIRIFGVDVMQTWFDLFFLNEILSNYQFDIIVELGTSAGGLTLFFALHQLRSGGEVLTFDTKPRPRGPMWSMIEDPELPFTSPVTFHQMDIFDAVGIIKRRIRNKRVLIFCDGGDKPDEFRNYAPLLQRGQVIMAHDKDREILWDDISYTVETMNLRPFYQDEADRCGADIWSFVK